METPKAHCESLYSNDIGIMRILIVSHNVFGEKRATPTVACLQPVDACTAFTLRCMHQPWLLRLFWNRAYPYGSTRGRLNGLTVDGIINKPWLQTGVGPSLPPALTFIVVAHIVRPTFPLLVDFHRSLTSSTFARTTTDNLCPTPVLSKFVQWTPVLK